MHSVHQHPRIGRLLSRALWFAQGLIPWRVHLSHLDLMKLVDGRLLHVRKSTGRVCIVMALNGVCGPIETQKGRIRKIWVKAALEAVVENELLRRRRILLVAHCRAREVLRWFMALQLRLTVLLFLLMKQQHQLLGQLVQVELQSLLLLMLH
jgi:hypothetical protein